MPEERGFAPPAPCVVPTPRWVRVRADGEWVADSRRAQLFVAYGPGLLPTYCFPEADVRTAAARGLLEEGAAQHFTTPPFGLEALRDHWTFTWDGRVSWFEEALEIHVHARDPTKRVDVVPSERHVRVELGGELLAESRTPHALFETTLPTRWYLPKADVRAGLLEPSNTVTSCPYKGTATYWSVRAGGELRRDLAWSYPEPVPECPRIAGLVCFFNEHVDLVIDGERQERPITPWSR